MSERPTNYQKRILRILRDKPSRLKHSQYEGWQLHVYSSDPDLVINAMHKTMALRQDDQVMGLVLDGFVKNIGSHQYKSYTISRSGVDAFNAEVQGD